MTQTFSPPSFNTAKESLDQVSKRLIGLTARRTGFCIGLSGSAGIGKTHTALKLLQASPCRSKVTQSTVGIQALTNILGGSKKPAGVIERNLQRIQNGERLEPQTLIEVCAAMLSVQAPFVLLVEDMHEANSEQLGFWNALSKMVTRLSGVAIIQTSRVQCADPIEHIILEPLSPAQSQSLLEQHLNAKLPIAALDWIYSRCAGNPLFTLEFTDFLTRHDALCNDGKTWKWREPPENSIPNTVEAIVGQWLADLALGAQTRAVLETKAYFETQAPGQVLDDQVWAALSELSFESLDTAKQQLEVLGVLKQNVFAHPLYREVTMQNVALTQRQQMARLATDFFTGSDGHLILSFFDDARFDKTSALRLLEQSANQAQVSGKTSDEAWLLTKAVEFAQGEHKGTLAMRAAQLLRAIDMAKAIELAQLASYSLLDNVEALLLICDQLGSQGRTTEITDVLERFPETLKHGLDWAERLVQWYVQDNDSNILMKLLDRHPELETSKNLSVVSYLIQYLMRLQKYDWAFCLAKKTLHLNRSELSVVQKMRLLGFHDNIFEIQKNFSQQELTYSEIVQLAESNKLPLHLCQGLYRRGIIRCVHIQESDALSDFEKAFQIAEQLGHLRAYHSNQMEIGRLKAFSGEFEVAEKMLIEAKNYFEKTSFGLCVLCCESLTILYDLWNVSRKKVLIQHYTNEAIRLFEHSKTPMYLPNIMQLKANLALLLGKPEECLEITNELRAQGAEVIAHGRALSDLKRSDEAKTYFQTAMQNPLLDQKVRDKQVIGLELDNLTRNTISARERMAWFESRGLKAYVQLIRRYFPELLETPQAPSSLTLENAPVLEVLGQMRINQHGKTAVVRGQKRQELLALLLHARMEGQSEIQMDDLRETLYTDQNLKDGSSALRQTIYKTRIQYGQNVIVTTNNGYALGNLNSDAETFLNDGNTRLWRDVYLSGIQLDHSDSIQENLNSKLFAQANDLLETDPKESARVVSILLQSNPYNLEALQVLCRALRVSGQHGALKRSYQRAREAFVEIGERLPETWAAFLEG